MTRIVISLDANERRALSLLAMSELRDPRLQMRYILRSELERRGLLDVQYESARVDPSPLNIPITQTVTKRKPARKAEAILTA